ncbi:MAG: hypothetical protein ACXVJD_05475 [Mucilaginibacter sp.]
MANQFSYGKEITAEQANQCIQSYRAIEEVLHSAVTDITASSSVETSAARDYLKGKYNAFVFDKASVERFFSNGNNADILMVILGAQPEDDTMNTFKKHDPTVILVGCKQIGDTFYSLPIEYPATEHPPRDVRTAIPNPIAGVPRQIEFTIR